MDNKNELPKEYEIINERTIFGNRTIIREKIGNDVGDGCFIIFWGPILLFLVFPIPFKLIDNSAPLFDLKLFNFSWYKEINIWLFCSSAWLLLFMSWVVLAYMIKNKTFDLKNFLTFPKSYFTINLFLISLAIFSLFIFSKYFNEKVSLIYTLISLALIYLLKLLIEKLDKEKLKLFLISSTLIFLSTFFIFFRFELNNKSNFKFVKEETRTNYINLKISPISGAKLRIKPTLKSDAIILINHDSEVTFGGDSSNVNGVIWYKVNYSNQTGWLRKKDLKN